MPIKSLTLLKARLESCLDCIPADTARVVLAYSGGIDSSVLLYLLTLRSQQFEILPWHVNHGLQDVAAEMEVFCRAAASQYYLTLKLSHLDMNPQAANQESEARNARYGLFEKYLTKKDCLLTAHHADDQVETFLLNALRGSGSAGLRGIAKIRPLGEAILLRPMLEVSREDILSYASHHEIEWFDDPGNISDRFNRNYLRNQVIPLLRDRWPGYLESVRSVVSIQAETQDALNELGAQDFQCLSSDSGCSDCLPIVELLALSRSRQKNVIRYWLQHYDHASLPQTRLNELVIQLNARHDAMPVIAGSGYDIRIYDSCLFLVPYSEMATPGECYHFDRQQVLTIDELGLQIERESIMRRLNRKDSGQSISLKFRRRGNSSNPDRHRLKRLFQKHKIPPWKRALTPQIYVDDELIDLWF